MAAVNFPNGPGDQEPEVFTKCWEYPSIAELSTLPTADDRSVFFLNSDRKLESADLLAARKIWSSELGGEVISNLLLADSTLLVVTSATSSESRDPGVITLRSLSKETGVTNWSRAMPGASRIWLGVVGDSVVAVDVAGGITAHNPADGSQLWTTNLGVPISADPQFSTGQIIVATAGKEIVKISAGGSTAVVSKTQFTPTAVLVASSSRYLIGDDRGNILLMAGGERDWKFRNGARISFLLSYDSEFIAASFDNFIYKISRGGNVEWKRRLSGRVASRPLILGDTAAVSIIGDGNIYFIDLKNGKITNRVDTTDGSATGTVTIAGASGLVISGTRGLSLYSRGKCPAK